VVIEISVAMYITPSLEPLSFRGLINIKKGQNILADGSWP
jgi:hypothetical protein